MFLRISWRKVKTTPRCLDFQSEILKNTLSNKLDKLFNTRETSLDTTSCLFTEFARVPVMRRKRKGGNRLETRRLKTRRLETRKLNRLKTRRLNGLKIRRLNSLRQVFILVLRSYSSMRSRYKISACIVQGDLKNVPTFKLH